MRWLVFTIPLLLSACGSDPVSIHGALKSASCSLAGVYVTYGIDLNADTAGRLSGKCIFKIGSQSLTSNIPLSSDAVECLIPGVLGTQDGNWRYNYSGMQATVTFVASGTELKMLTFYLPCQNTYQ